MVGTWTYDPVANVITVVGGTAGAPAGLVDAWNADKAGSRTLLAATASPFTASLTTAIKPCESLALKISIIITNFSVAGTVVLSGKDAWGNNVTETLTVAGNGTLISTLYYASIDANGVVAAGTFSVAVSQPRWGVIWKQTAYQYAFDCYVKIGDGSTATYFADSAKHITFNNFFGFGAVLWETTANATFTSGTLLNEANKTTCNGLHFFIANVTGNRSWIQNDTNSSVYFYSTTFEAATNADFYISYYPKRMWNCNLHQAVMRYSANVDFFNVLFWNTGNNGCFQNSYSGNTLNKIAAFACSAVIKTDGTGPPIIYNLWGRNNSCILLWNNNQVGATAYLVNPDIDNYLFSFTANNSTVYRQYEFDLTTDPSATVTLKNAAGATVFSLTSDASTGAIATQTVSRGYYDTAHGNTLQDYGPFTLTITKAGKMPYTQTGIVLTEKTKLLIALRDQLTGTADIGDVAVGVSFYKENADTKLTGTLVLTGNAEPKDVAEGKTFYQDDMFTKRTGTHNNPSVFIDIASGKLILNLNKKNIDNQCVFSL